jgi:hypothetical protein
MRSVSKRGAMIDGDVQMTLRMLDGGLQSPNAEEFVRDGAVLLAALAKSVHEGVDPGPELEEETRGFMAFARVNFSENALGGAVERADLSSDAAVALLTAGKWDPFADVQMPPTP